MADEVATTDIDRLKRDPKYQIVRGTYAGGPGQLQMNTSKPPLDELPVRQALEYAINQEELVKVLFQGAYTAAHTPVSPGCFGYDESLASTYRTDPAKARELLDGAGWKPGPDGLRARDGKPLELSIHIISDAADTAKATELIQAQLREVGVRLKIQPMDTAAWVAATGQGTQQMVIGWRGASDPDFLRPIFHSSFIGKSPLQRTHFKDERLDQVLDQGAREQDRTKRLALYKEAQQIILKQALIVPLWDRYNYIGARASVRDLGVDLRGYPRLYDVWLAK